MPKSRKLTALAIFVFSFAMLVIFKPTFVSISKNYLVTISQSVLDSWVNEEYKFEKIAKIAPDRDSFVKTSCLFYSDGGTVERYVLIDTFTEFALPMMLVVSLALALLYYFKPPYHFFIFSFALGGTIFTLKIIAMIFDNYNYSSYLMTEFSFPLKQIIYYFNKLLNITGSSLNFVIPILIVLIAMGVYHKKINISSSQIN